MDWSLRDWAVTLMPGVAYNRPTAAQGFPSGLVSFVANHAWTARFQSFVEWAAQQVAQGKDGGTVQTLDFGATYGLASNVQLDGAVFWGLNRQSPVSYETLGVSVRFL